MFEFIEDSLLEKLSIDTKPVWGTMTAQHMIEHLVQTLKASNGNSPINDCMNPPEKFPILKKILLSNRPLPKGFVNTIVGEGLKPLQFENLDSAKNELKKEVNFFFNYFNQHPSEKPNNPTFGPLNYEEWIVFHKKHFMHHYTQFGLIPAL